MLQTIRQFRGTYNKTIVDNQKNRQKDGQTGNIAHHYRYKKTTFKVKDVTEIKKNTF